MARGPSRRTFISTGGAAAAAAGATGIRLSAAGPELHRALDAALARPVLRRDLLPGPVIIERVELLRAGEHFLVRARSREGATGVAVGHPEVLDTTWPILTGRVAPFFAGKDARDLDGLVDGVYLADSNYKWQGLPFWVPVASVEAAVLDLLGRVSGRPVGDLLGGVQRREIAVYRASGNRGNTPAEEIRYLESLVAETGARAIKFRLGARMRHDAASTRRDEALIPLVRRTFGDAMTIYGDANGSYDIPTAQRIGRLMRGHGLAFLEEPVPFDFYEETKAIADDLALPVAGGEQESSLRRFRWMIAHQGVDIVQPDLFYFGGFVRAIRVARMAAAAGMPCTPHMSGGGLGFLYVAHFASCVENAGPFQEYKGTDRTLPVSSPTSRLAAENGMLIVPSGPGFGVEFDPSFLARATIVA